MGERSMRMTLIVHSTVPRSITRAEPDYGATFLPEHEARPWATSPRAEVVPMPGAGHNIRGDRSARVRYLDVLGTFLARQKLHGATIPDSPLVQAR